MSAVCILTPTIIAAWPAISAAVAGAAAALGLSVAAEGARGVASVAGAVRAAHADTVNAVEVEVENCEVVGEVIAAREEIALVKGDIRVRVVRDVRGACKVSVEGKGRSEEELREFGERFVQKITQMYVYNRVMTELRSKGFTVVKEAMAEDETVHIHVRQQVL